MNSFDTAAPVTAVLDIPAGRVQVIAADRADATVEVRPANAAKSRDVEQAEHTTVDFLDGVLRVASPVRHQVLGGSGTVEVTVQVPAGSRLEVSVASADVRAVGRFGDVVVDGAHGSIKVDEAAGVRLTTLAGDVTVGRLTGPGEVRTSKGDIRITEAVRGEVVLRTEAGDVTVGAAPGVSATLDAGTGSGRIHNALRSTGVEPDLTVHATTAYGNITAGSS